MGFPKIPDPQEIANMTAEAMEPMMDKLDRLIELLEEQNDLLRNRRETTQLTS
jgi:hypothetical protein